MDTHPNQQAIEHEYRIRAIEKGYDALMVQLKAIDERGVVKMDALAVKLDAAMSRMISHACPTPGACGKLMNDMLAITNEVQRLEKQAIRHEEERQEVVEKLNSIQTDIAVSKGGLRVTIFWVGVMASAVGGGAAIAIPLLTRLLIGR